MAEVIHKLNQVAEGQLRLEAQTSRMDALHKIPELMQKVEHVIQGLERLNAHSHHGDTLHAISALKRATSVQANSAHTPPSRVGKQVESGSSGDKACNRARSRVTCMSEYRATLVFDLADIRMDVLSCGCLDPILSDKTGTTLTPLNPRIANSQRKHLAPRPDLRPRYLICWLRDITLMSPLPKENRDRV